MVALISHLVHLLTCRHRRSQTQRSQVEVAGNGEQKQRSKSSVERSTDLKSEAFSAESTASDLKVKGNAYLAEGDVAAAVACWTEARMRATNDSGAEETVELLRSLDANLALGHLRLQDWSSALVCADAALLEPNASSPIHVKVLHRRALALAGLKRWSDAEQALEDFAEAGGASSLAAQTRRDWERAKRKIAAVVSKTLRGEDELVSRASAGAWAQDECWSDPKLDWMAVFPLREHSSISGTCWDETADDFNDAVWTPDGMTGRKPSHFATSVPLTLLAGATLAKLKLPEEATIHILHGGKIGTLTHDWGSVLSRCPHVQKLNVVYVAIFGAKDSSEIVLTRPVEEASRENRVVKVSHFAGGYNELLAIIESNDLKELGSPCLALSLDIPIAIDSPVAETQLRDVLSALAFIAGQNAPLLVTLPANSRERHLRAPAQRAIATLRLLQPKVLVDWQWNRFAVCKKTKQDENSENHVFIGAHAVIGVFSLDAEQLKQDPLHLLKTLDARRVPQDSGEDYDDLIEVQEEDRAEKIRETVDSERFKKQFQAFTKRMQKEGRPTGSDISREEQHRQGMEFAAWIQSCGRDEWEDECLASVEDASDGLDPSTIA